MNIYLGEHFEAMIRERVASGRYANAGEVVRAALRVYEEQEYVDELIAAADVADAEIARGEAVPFTHELMLRIKEEAMDGASPRVQPR